MDITSSKHVTQMRYMWTSYIVMLQQSSLKKTLNFFMKVYPPFLNIFLRARNNIMLLLMFRVKWRVVFLIPFTGLYYYILYLPIYIYIFVYCIYIYHQEWLTTHTIMSSKWYFSMNPKLNIIIIAVIPITFSI
jgi:hypothetical protein